MIKIEEIVDGSGEVAKSGNTVELKYRGTFPQGGEFDKGTFKFTIGSGQVIQGFDLGVTGMKVGGKRKLVIPSDLAYGESGSPPTIPPNAPLKFDVELLDVK